MLAGGATMPLLSRRFVGYVETLSLLVARPLQCRRRSRDGLKQRSRPALSVAADVQNNGRLEAPPTRPPAAPRDAMEAAIIKCGSSPPANPKRASARFCRDSGGAAGRSWFVGLVLLLPCQGPVCLWEGAERDKTAERQAMRGPSLLPYVASVSLSPTKSSIHHRILVFS